MKRNLREEIEQALAGGAPERMPFTYYDLLTPPGFDLAPLQARGLAICARRPVWRKTYADVEVHEQAEPDGVIRTVYSTPVGAVTARRRAAAQGEAPLEHPIKTRDDYRIARFIVEHTRYEPCYDAYAAEIRKLGDAGKVIAHTCYEPLLDLQIVWIGQEQFCYELVDNEDALLELHEALARNHRAMYDVVARSPADHVLYGGNVVPAMLGPERVRDLVAPCWNAFADRLHAAGKKIGCHLDADNRAILDTVGGSRLDFVEAFTPPPDCPVSVTEARAAWPGKRLWLNFPSSVHLQAPERIRASTRELLAQAGDRRGVLLGVTEDVPADRMMSSFHAILDALEQIGD